MPIQSYALEHQEYPRKYQRPTLIPEYWRIELREGLLPVPEYHQIESKNTMCLQSTHVIAQDSTRIQTIK